MKTLIVEDDFTSRMVLQALLSPFGECHIAVNGREAVEAYRLAAKLGQRYQLVCMDIMMPDMDGRAALREIREMEQSDGVTSEAAKVIMTTAMGDMKTVFASFNEMCDAYLVKPIEAEKLFGYLRSFGLITSVPLPETVQSAA